MLYNPKWDCDADPRLALGSLVAWLKTKNPALTYNYTCTGECLLAQYFKAAGFRNVRVNGSTWTCGPDGKEHEIPAGWNEIAAARPHTFGAALGRAMR